jgi:hypothetical protein
VFDFRNDNPAWAAWADRKVEKLSGSQVPRYAATPPPLDPTSGDAPAGKGGADGGEAKGGAPGATGDQAGGQKREGAKEAKEAKEAKDAKEASSKGPATDPWEPVEWVQVHDYKAGMLKRTTLVLAREEKETIRKAGTLAEKAAHIEAQIRDTRRDAAPAGKRWQESGADHERRFSLLLIWVAIIVASAAELVTAYPLFRALQLVDWHNYIAAAGVVAVAVLASKSIAVGAHTYTEHAQSPAKRRLVAIALVLGLTTLAALLVGMYYVRVGWDVNQSASGSSETLSGSALWGLTSIQFALVVAQTVALFYLLPSNPAADRARRQWLDAQQRVAKLTRRLLTVNGRRNTLIRLHWAHRHEAVAHCFHNIFEYQRALNRYSTAKSKNLFEGFDSRCDDRWFPPPLLTLKKEHAPEHLGKLAEVGRELESRPAPAPAPVPVPSPVNSAPGPKPREGGRPGPRWWRPWAAPASQREKAPAAKAQAAANGAGRPAAPAALPVKSGAAT